MSTSDTSSTQSPPLATLGWALATLFRDYQKQIETALAGLPGGGRAFLVMSLVQRETCQSQIAIAERISLDKTTLTYLLDGLEKEDLIRRVSDPNDRRSRHIQLTPAGTKALAGFSQAVAQIEEGILARLDSDDAARFRVSLNRVAGLDRRAGAGDAEHDHDICKSIVTRG